MTQTKSTILAEMKEKTKICLCEFLHIDPAFKNLSFLMSAFLTVRLTGRDIWCLSDIEVIYGIYGLDIP